MKTKYIVGILLVLMFFSIEDVNAQCQMCKATVESNLGNGGNKGIGINTGIIYLLAMPYALAMTVGTIVYLKYKKNKAV